MQIVKMFDWYDDIQPYLNTLDIQYDLHDLGECIRKGTAIPFWVCKDEFETDFENILVEYFLSQGCKQDEKVYIKTC